MNIKQRFVFSGWILALALGGALSARADFIGPFATNNWTFVNSNANGSIDLALAPQAVRLIGGNFGIPTNIVAGITEWTITFPFTGEVSFDWNYATTDSTDGPYDRAGWRQNGVFTQIVANNSSNFSGHVSATVTNGDVFGFWVRTDDNFGGPGEFSITNFVATNSLPALPRFLATTRSNETVHLRLETIPGRTYQLEAAAELPALSWVAIDTNILAVTNITARSVPFGSFTQRFFRAILLPP